MGRSKELKRQAGEVSHKLNRFYWKNRGHFRELSIIYEKLRNGHCMANIEGDFIEGEDDHLTIPFIRRIVNEHTFQLGTEEKFIHNFNKVFSWRPGGFSSLELNSVQLKFLFWLLFNRNMKLTGNLYADAYNALLAQESKWHHLLEAKRNLLTELSREMGHTQEIEEAIAQINREKLFFLTLDFTPCLQRPALSRRTFMKWAMGSTIAALAGANIFVALRNRRPEDKPVIGYNVDQNIENEGWSDYGVSKEGEHEDFFDHFETFSPEFYNWEFKHKLPSVKINCERATDIYIPFAFVYLFDGDWTFSARQNSFRELQIGSLEFVKTGQKIYVIHSRTISRLANGVKVSRIFLPQNTVLSNDTLNKLKEQRRRIFADTNGRLYISVVNDEHVIKFSVNETEGDLRLDSVSAHDYLMLPRGHELNKQCRIQGEGYRLMCPLYLRNGHIYERFNDLWTYYTDIEAQKQIVKSMTHFTNIREFVYNLNCYFYYPDNYDKYIDNFKLFRGKGGSFLEYISLFRISDCDVTNCEAALRLRHFGVHTRVAIGYAFYNVKYVDSTKENTTNILESKQSAAISVALPRPIRHPTGKMVFPFEKKFDTGLELRFSIYTHGWMNYLSGETWNILEGTPFIKWDFFPPAKYSKAKHYIVENFNQQSQLLLFLINLYRERLHEGPQGMLLYGIDIFKASANVMDMKVMYYLPDVRIYNRYSEEEQVLVKTDRYWPSKGVNFCIESSFSFKKRKNLKKISDVKDVLRIIKSEMRKKGVSCGLKFMGKEYDVSPTSPEHRGI